MGCKEYRIFYTQYEGDAKIGEGISCETYPSIIYAKRHLPDFEQNCNEYRQVAKIIECVYPNGEPCEYVDIEE